MLGRIKMGNLLKFSRQKSLELGEKELTQTTKHLMKMCGYLAPPPLAEN